MAGKKASAKTTSPTKRAARGTAGRSAAKKAPPRLRRDAVVRTALDLLDEVGLDGLTMRRLAEALGVQNPALYWHFESKQALLDAMARVLLDDAFGALPPRAEREDWRAFLRTIAGAFRSAMRAHRDGARVLAEANLMDSPMLGGLDRALRVLVDEGFATRDAFVGILALFDYTMGATFEAESDPGRAARDAGLAASDHPLRAVPDRERFPTLAAVFEEMAREAPELDHQATYEGGVELILDGLASRRRGS